MANEDRRSISFALIGHGGDGKTTLADSLLFAAGVTSRLGRVDDGTSFMNWLPEEKVRRASISDVGLLLRARRRRVHACSTCRATRTSAASCAARSPRSTTR